MHKNLFEYQDSLAILNNNGSLQDKLTSIHEVITVTFPYIDRIAVAVFEEETDMLKTFVASCYGENPLLHYDAKLSETPSLREILTHGKPRVINHLEIFSTGKNEHTIKLAKMNYAASYTMPIYQNGIFFGFVFFNSTKEDVFREQILHQLDLFGHMISLMIMNELSAAYTLTAALKTTGEIVQKRDPETGCHIDRMSRYTRLIATELACKYEFDDEYIEQLFIYSPLHDIGKVGIPDSILQKPGALSRKEFDEMKTHTIQGRELIDHLLQNFGKGVFLQADMLRNIAMYHHEAINGSGYPEGKKGDEIPIEAKIVAVADVFDALTSSRSYKDAWTNEKAFEMLKKLAGNTLDHDCVSALVNNEEKIRVIQKDFKENPYG